MSTASEPPPLRIRAYSDLEAPEALRSQIEEILLVSANPRRVADEASRAAFLDRWLTPYLEAYPEQLLLALEEAEDGQVLGVLNGCPDSAGATVFRDLHPYYRLFADLYEDYPAHFHVNCHPEHRGRGLATRLVATAVAESRGQHARVCLHVGAANQPARRAYARAGMAPVGSCQLMLKS